MRVNNPRRMCTRKVVVVLLLSQLLVSISQARPRSERKYNSPFLNKLLTTRGRESWVKRGCHVGLPCTYSHLSSLAADRTLQRMLVDYMHNCVNDPHCSPVQVQLKRFRTKGRRKRDVVASKSRTVLMDDREKPNTGILALL